MVMSPLSFPIIFVSLLSLAKDLSILLIFPEKQHPHSIYAFVVAASLQCTGELTPLSSYAGLFCLITVFN